MCSKFRLIFVRKLYRTVGYSKNSFLVAFMSRSISVDNRLYLKDFQVHERKEAEILRYGLQGKIAIVTGAASGMGEATAKRLSEYGVTVLVNDVNST